MMTMSSGREGWGEDPFAIGQEALAIDRSLDQPWGHHPVMSQGGDEGRGSSGRVAPWPAGAGRAASTAVAILLFAFRRSFPFSLRRSCTSNKPGVSAGRASNELIGEVANGARIYAQHRVL